MWSIYIYTVCPNINTKYKKTYILNLQNGNAHQFSLIYMFLI